MYHLQKKLTIWNYSYKLNKKRAKKVTKMTIEQIKDYMKREKITQIELSEKSGIPLQTLRKIFSGIVRNPRIDTMQAIEKALGVSDENTYINVPGVRAVKLQKVPMLGDIACGKPIYANENFETYVDASADIKADFCLTAKGDSMTGARINDGDIVFIREQPIVENGQIAAVLIGNEVTLKRWFYHPEENKLTLQPANQLYEAFTYTGEDLNQIRCLGLAVCFMSLVK